MSSKVENHGHRPLNKEQTKRPLQSDVHTVGVVAWLKISLLIAVTTLESSLWKPETDADNINIIWYLQLIRQRFTEKCDGKSNSEADGIRHEQNKEVNKIDANQ